MKTQEMQRIVDKIKEYDRIVLTRHSFPDGDAIGSSKGLQRILQLSYPQKQVYLINEDVSDSLAFLGEEDAPLPEEDYRDALVIVLDTGTTDRISNRKYACGREVIKIDHHIDDKPFGDISWVENQRSSTSEMVAALYEAFRDEWIMDKAAATCLYAGIVTDSGRFRFDNTDGDTLRLAGMLLDFGIDTESLFCRLYLNDFSRLQFQAAVYRLLKRTKNGVAYIYLSRAAQKRFSLSHEEAGSVVSMMDGIKGSLIWLAFIENEDKTIRVRLRSRYLPIQPLAVSYHGGGHDKASGATCYGKKEMCALLADADALLGAFKAQNPDCL